MSSSVSDSSRSSRLRDSSGEITLKDGFSVVAATRVTQRFSTPGSSASCCALLKRCTSSTKSTVSLPEPTSVARAASIAARTSFTPAETALTSTKRRPVCRLRIDAIVVLPVPGGPHSNKDIAGRPRPAAAAATPGALSCAWPTSSSRSRGRIRTANGAAAWTESLSDPPPLGLGSAPGASNSASSDTRPIVSSRVSDAYARPIVLPSRSNQVSA